jgi:hypothetical protein
MEDHPARSLYNSHPPYLVVLRGCWQIEPHGKLRRSSLDLAVLPIAAAHAGNWQII